MSLVTLTTPPPRLRDAEANSRSSIEDIRNFLNAVIIEFLNSAVLTAASAGVANALQNATNSLEMRLAVSCLPPRCEVFPKLRSKLSLDLRSHEFAAAIGDFYSHLQPIRNLTQAAIRTSQLTADAMIDRRVLAIAWTDVAKCALDTLDREECFIANACEGVQGRCVQVRELLTEATLGGTPCLGDDGSIDLPAWTERRLAKRIAHNIQVIFMISGTFQRCSVLDASEYGLGVLGLTNVSIGERVSLLMKPGHQIDGLIAWINGSRAGIELDEALPADSQILSNLH